MTFSIEKLEWCGYPMVKKNKDTFIRFDTIYERDGRTHRHTIGRTDGHTDGHRMTA